MCIGKAPLSVDFNVSYIFVLPRAESSVWARDQREQKSHSRADDDEQYHWQACKRESGPDSY